MVDPSSDTKVTIESFRGLFSRGDVDDVPPDYAQDCSNLVFTREGHVKTRDGITQSLHLGYSGGIRRFFLMTSTPPNVLQPVTGPAGITEGSGLLVLDDNNNLYIGNSSSPLKQINGMADFCALNLGNRVYVSPNNGQTGFRGGRLQVINPFTGSIRDAAGLAPAQPSSLLAAAESATAGVVPAGVHQFAVVYETDTGFWTPPGPKHIVSITPAASSTAVDPTIITCTAHGMQTGESHQISGATGNWTPLNDVWHIDRIDDDHFSVPLDSFGFGAPAGSIVVDGAFTAATVTSTGAFKVALSNIPTGGSFVKRRIIIGTRADETEFFFIPNKPGCVSEINNNTATTTTIDFEDSDLIDSADALFDNLEVIPGGGGLAKYRSRMVIAGPYFPGNQEKVILSDINDPETFNYVSGYIQVQTERDGNNVNNAFVLRDTLYMSKFTGTFSTEDNGDVPSSWSVSVVDAVIGCYGYGASSFTASQPAPDTGDIILMASRPGLYMFDGVFRRPELTYPIESLWLRINFAYFFRVTVTHDPWHHMIYISAPLDSATTPDTLLVCDYSDGRSADKVRWSKFTLPFDPTCIGMVYFGVSTSPTYYTLKIGTLTTAYKAYLYTLTDGETRDLGQGISNFYTPGPIIITKGAVNCFKMIVPRATGVGTIKFTLTKEDGIGTVTPPVLTLGTAPGRDLQRQINFVNEAMNMKIENALTSAGTPTEAINMKITRITVWGTELFPVRPGA